MKTKNYIVEKENEGKRIDSYLAKKDEKLSREAVQRLIKEGKIQVDGKEIKPSYKIQENDDIKVVEEEPKEISLEAENIPVEVLYQDEDIIVVNKPKGMVVHPGNRKPKRYISKLINVDM